MLAATHFDNLLVLVFFGIAVLFQVLSAAVAKNRKRREDQERRSTSPSQTSRPLETEVEDSDEDRIRKFLEALGQPTTSKPPAPAASRPTYQKPIVAERTEPEPARRRSVLSPLPPLTTRPPDLPRETPPVIPKREPAVTQPKAAEASKFEVHEGPPSLQPIPEAKAAYEPSMQASTKRLDVRTMLRSTSGLRDAMILREIFGPPRSMQPLDLVGSV